MILPHGPCGHFVLSTLLEARLKDDVFETNVKTLISPKTHKSKTVKVDTDTKNRIRVRYYLEQFNTFAYITLPISCNFV